MEKRWRSAPTVLITFIAIILTASAVPTRAQTATADVKLNLAPTGTLRIAINYGNAALATRDAAGELHGVSVDIAHELGKRLDLPLTLIPFDAAGKVSGAASDNIWDVAFLARDPERARNITSPPPTSSSTAITSCRGILRSRRSSKSIGTVSAWPLAHEARTTCFWRAPSSMRGWSKAGAPSGRHRPVRLAASGLQLGLGRCNRNAAVRLKGACSCNLAGRKPRNR
jgi:hypothetical protein